LKDRDEMEGEVEYGPRELDPFEAGIYVRTTARHSNSYMARNISIENMKGRCFAVDAEETTARVSS
jgi:hypothetical protein